MSDSNENTASRDQFIRNDERDSVWSFQQRTRGYNPVSSFCVGSSSSAMDITSNNAFPSALSVADRSVEVVTSNTHYGAAVPTKGWVKAFRPDVVSWISYSWSLAGS